MIQTYTCSRGRVTAVSGPPELHPPGGGASLWVEVSAPSPEEVALLVEGMNLHELSIADALRPEHLPKLEDFENYLFFIAHTPSLSGRSTRKIAVFLGKDWIVTIVRTPLPLMEEARQRALREPLRYLADPGFLAYELLFRLNERFETLTDAYLKRVEALEHKAASDFHPDILLNILAISQEVGHFTRVMRYQREMCQSLSHHPYPVLSKKVQPYLRDAYDQVLQVNTLLEGVRDGIGAARITHLAAVNNRLGDVMRTLTGIATVLMPLTLITGFFGMNFDAIPGLHSVFAFWLVAGIIFTLGVVFWLWFRGRHWL